MPRPVRIFGGVIALGVVLLAVLALTRQTTQAFTLGVPNSAPVAELDGGGVACQAPITIPDDDAEFDTIRLTVGTYEKPGPELQLTVAPVAGGAPIAEGRIAAGYPDITEQPSHAVHVGHVGDRDPLKVCIRNAGPGRVAIYGSGELASRTSSTTIDGNAKPLDLNLVFERSEGRSIASLLPAMAERASLFRADWVGAWTYVLAALLVLLAVPALLALALRDAATDDG